MAVHKAHSVHRSSGSFCDIEAHQDTLKPLKPAPGAGSEWQDNGRGFRRAESPDSTPRREH
jgi:hypothetical protein